MANSKCSWREQAKPIIATVSDADASDSREYPSLWQAALAMSTEFGCLHATAKKEIRRSIKTGKPRYNRLWKWKMSNS